MKGYTFDGSTKDYLMRCNGFSCGLNMPDALEGEKRFCLPPYAKRMPFLVDEYPACPKTWMRSEGKIKSYFVAVEEGKGMWLDFNNNEYDQGHHVAVVVSIQGINPITGLPCKDAQLEQYIEECPKHKKKFGPDRFCKKCGYKWPKQNYLCTTGTPSGSFWLDGFKTAEGVVRQYILTQEKLKGVASNLIGNDRVFAIGVSFFLSKQKRPLIANSYSFNINPIAYGSPKYYSTSTPTIWTTPPDWSTGNGTISSPYYTCLSSITDDDEASSLYDDLGFTQICASSAGTGSEASSLYDDLGFTQICASSAGTGSSGSFARNITPPLRQVSTKKLEVGAGAEISQIVYNDPEKLEYWHNDPEAIICVNYCIEKDAAKIIEAGHSPIKSHPEGFLKNVPVGNLETP